MATSAMPLAGGSHGSGLQALARFILAATQLPMGLLFFLSGLNGFLNLLPQPSPSMPEGALAFTGAMVKTGYRLPLVMGTQLIVCALLLVNRFVSLAVALIAPVVVNIVAFHSFLSPSGLDAAGVVLTLGIYLAYVYRNTFRPVLAMRAIPGDE